MDSRLRGNDINCILDRHSRDRGNDAIDEALVAATAAIPAKPVLAKAGFGRSAPMNFRTDAIDQDWLRLARHLDAHGRRLVLDAPPRQFASGFANFNYLLDVDGKPCVLRRPPPGPLPPGAHDMVREHRVLSRLWRAFPLAPRAFHLCEDTSVLGAPFFLMEYRPGVSIGAELPPALAGRPEQAARIASDLVDVLADLHRVAPADVDLDSLGRPQGFLARQVSGWAKRAHLAYDERPGPRVRRIVGWLEDHVEPERAVSLVHNDFKLDNVLLDPDRFTPVAVVDWDMCTRGCPLYDLAILVSYWTEPDDPPAMHLLRQMPSAAPGFPRRAEVLDAYARRSGIDIGDFRFHRALSVFRLAIVFRQLVNLYARAERTSPESANFGDVAEGLLDFAADIVEGRRD